MKLEPVGKVATYRIERQCRAGGYDEIKEGDLVEGCQLPDGTPLYAIPAGHVLVKAEPDDEDLFRAWVGKANGMIDDLDRFLVAYKAMTQGEQT